jgi:hypothetical protein
MFILIDEAGGFVRSPDRRRSISCVGGLVVPDKQIRRMYREFERLRKKWPLVDGETKGRLLDEPKIDATIKFLRRFDVLYEAIVLDLNMHAEEQITAHQLIQAEKITEHVTPAFTPEAAQSAWDMRSHLEGMPNQLYAQSIAMLELAYNVIQRSTLYYCQRKPDELSGFNWIVDAKEIKGVTKFEN